MCVIANYKIAVLRFTKNAIYTRTMTQTVSKVLSRIPPQAKYIHSKCKRILYHDESVTTIYILKHDSGDHSRVGCRYQFVVALHGL